MTTAERSAVITDATARLVELAAVRALLLPDADDAMVASELTTVESQILAARDALRTVEEVA